MVRMIYGSAGSGKSRLVRQMIREDLLAGKRVLLLLPEQAGVRTERSLSSFLSDVPTAELEILNFKRLSNRVFREYGGLSYHYIGHGGKRLIMSTALREVLPSLAAFRSVDPTELTVADAFLSDAEQLMTYHLTPGMLDETAEKISTEPGTSVLCAKLHDYALINAAYSALLHHEYDDPSDDPDRMNELLHKHAYFHGMSVYLDGFYGFTPQQYETIRYILRDAEDVAFTLSYDPAADRGRLPFSGISRTDDKLNELFGDRAVERRTLHEPPALRSSFLRWVCKSIWQPCQETAPQTDGSVRVFRAPSIFAEAEFIARDVAKHVQNGAEYRDFCVITRSEEAYSGVLDAVFAKYGIPYFFAQKSPLSSQPAVRYLQTLLRSVIYARRADDVIGLLKSGFTPLSYEDACLLENYIRVWNLSGRDFDSDRDWIMHPRGYIAKFSTQDKDQLARILSAREQFLSFYLPVEEALTEARTVRAFAEAIFLHLEHVGMEQKLADAAQACRITNPSAAQETAQVYGALCDTFDSLVSVLGEERADLSLFERYLDMVLSDADIGHSPTATDEVTVGSAVLLRPENCKYLYLIGCNEGEFPKAVHDDDVFSDAEKETLRRHIANLPETTVSRCEDEMFYFYHAACCAGESLTVTYPAADFSGKEKHPSGGVLRLMTLLGTEHAPTTETSDPLSLLVSGPAAVGTLAQFADTTFGMALDDYLHDVPGTVSEHHLQAIGEPLSPMRERLDRETVARLFPGDLNMTQARLEAYQKCAFMYYCDYPLHLAEYEKISFEMVDTGNLTHDVLEKYMRAFATDKDPDKYTEEYIDDYTGQLVDRYFENMLKRKVGEMTDRRFAYQIRRIKNAIRLFASDLTAEFRASHFVPYEFEYKFSAEPEKEDGIRPLEIDLKDGRKARIFGTVDRIDTFEKDGKTYVRVADYKTGTKSFNIETVQKGMDMQMLLYLFAIWKNGEEKIGTPIEPAGVLYVKCHAPDEAGNVSDESKDFKIERDGILIDDPEIIYAMDPEGNGRYIPASFNKDGSLSKSSRVTSLEAFAELQETVEKNVRIICSRMTAGEADAVPITRRDRSVKTSPCTYCKYGAVCRRIRK